MAQRKPRSVTKEFERAVENPPRASYLLRLYVAGTTPKSARAIQNIRAICDERLAGRYRLEVVDIYQCPDLTRPDQIVVAPTLVKKLPLPVRRIIGDLSNTNQVLVGLDLVPL